MNSVVEMMNQSTARIRKISEGGYNGFVMKGDRRVFRMQIELLNTAIRGYRAASKNKRIADSLQKMNIIGGITLVELGLGDSEIESVKKQVIEKIDQVDEVMKKIMENRSAVELDAAMREYKLQSMLFNIVIRASKVTSKNKDR